jgi:hypothetical protein
MIVSPEMEPPEAPGAADDREAAFFAEGPPVEPGPSFPDGEGACEVVLAEHPHPLCRMRAFIGLVRGAEKRVFEIAGAQNAGLVDLLLGAARPALTVRRADDFDDLVVVKSFDVAAGATSAVETALHRHLTGNTAGLLPIVQAMSFFHTGFGAFEALRTAAGHPPVRLQRMGTGASHASIVSARDLPTRAPRDGSAA